MKTNFLEIALNDVGSDADERFGISYAESQLMRTNQKEGRLKEKKSKEKKKNELK